MLPTDPSTPVTDVSILTALRDRLMAARTAVPNATPCWNYPLNDVVLPAPVMAIRVRSGPPWSVR
jgi:hypothetical protein